MYLVTQTNVASPKQQMVMTREQADRVASEMCPEPGDGAIIYQLFKVATVEAIQTVDIKEIEE